MDISINQKSPGKTGDAAALAKFAQRQFRALADPAKAGPMAAYMRTKDPFYGVQAAGVDAVAREVLARFPCSDYESYERNVLALWQLPHREERYLAVRYARQKKFVSPVALPLYERMIREGAWWDLVDEISSHLVGVALLAARGEVEPVMDRWVAGPNTGPDMWLRRTAVIAHRRHGRDTNQEQLFRYCLLLADDKEFFIRKAIGWALREYGKTAPEAVAGFLTKHRRRLSALSLREGSRRLILEGWLVKGFEKESLQ